MRILAACALSMLVVAGCGGGSAGPTAPAGPANVAGTWSGTSTQTVTAGPACLSRQPVMVPATVQITQSGAAISGTLTLGQTPCSFHGTVSGTTILWTQDAQQANFFCLAFHLAPCLGPDSLAFLDLGGQVIDVSGTVSGAQLGASGSASSNIADPTNGQVVGTVQSTVKLTLQRQ